MLLSTYCESDGRLHRARRSMRKLLALGLSKNEIVALYHHVLERRVERLAFQDETLDPSDRDERLRQAQDCIRRLIALGFAEVDIADLGGLSPTTITRALDPHEARALGSETVQRLQGVVRQAGAHRLNALLPHVRVTVLETCCDKGRPVDPVPHDQLETGARAVLRDALLGLHPSADTVAPGVKAVLFELGEPEVGVVVMVAPRGRSSDSQARLAQLRALEHEVSHLLQRYRAERERIESELRPARQRALPKDGTIA